MRLVLYFLFYYLFILWYGVHFLSFSIVEQISITKFWPLKYILNFSIYLFGKNDFAIRIPQILFGILSIILFYNLAENYFKKQRDIYFSVIIFSLIPGVIISTFIVNKSIYIIFLTLLFIFLFRKFKLFSYIYLFFLALLDKSFIVLYIGLIFYAIYKKDNFLLVLSLILLTLNANYFNYKIGGKPKGYFLDVVGTYSLIFSPFVFFYFVYSLYKGFFTKKDIIFFVSVTAFLVSILFSFRQRIKIDDYAPFVLPYTLYMIKIFLNSYRVRLPQFRTFHNFLFIMLFSSVILFDIAMFLNKYTPAREIVKSFYFIKPLSKKLKELKIDKIYCNNKFLCKSLYFYGIKRGDNYFILYSKSQNRVSIFHNKKKIFYIDVSKLNTL